MDIVYTILNGFLNALLLVITLLVIGFWVAVGATVGKKWISKFYK